MTEKYPLLTTQNINYWYWECDPHWSQNDIAKEVGCTSGNIYHFMAKHNIPTRDYSDAQINRFNCPKKLENHCETMNQEEVRNSLSEKGQELWRASGYRKRLTKAHQERGKNTIGFTQFKVLKALYNNPNKMLVDLMVLPTLSSFTKKKLDAILERLYIKSFITQKKDFKDKNTKMKPNFYSISEKGRKIYEENSDEDTIKKLRERRLGKIQVKILSLIEKKGSLFYTEIVAELKKDSISHNSVQYSLSLLYKNKFLFRAKKFNKDLKKSNKLEFKYSLNKFDENIQESYKGLGTIQYNLLKVLTKSKGYFFRELKEIGNIKDFSRTAIVKALTKLHKDELVSRVKKIDSASTRNNSLKYFYSITNLGEKTLELVS